MRTGFVLPSCSYNIVLSEDELIQLLERGRVLMQPSKTKGRFVDEYGKRNDTFGHGLTYHDGHGEEPVQFISIAIENNKIVKEDNNEQSRVEKNGASAN